MALSRIDTTNMIEDVPQSKLDNNVNFRNIIINGDMSIAQRSTSVASITTTGYHTVDRFQQFVSSAGTWTLSQDTDVPSGQGFSKSMKYDCTTADGSLSASSLLLFQQKFEGQNLQYLKKGTSSAESLTVSFWVKSNKTGTYICQFRDIDNSRSISQSYTISSANTWEKKIITIPGDTTGAFDNDNGESLRLLFFLGAGSNYTSGTLGTTWGTEVTANRAVGQVNLADSTANEWYITGVQLEAGQTASEFEFLPVDVNLQRCERYHQRTELRYFLAGRWGASSGSGLGMFFFRTQMRDSPSASHTGTFSSGSGWGGDPTFFNANPNSIAIQATATIGANENQYINGGIVILDSEL